MRESILIFVAVSLLSVPVVSAQDLSKYRNFSLGSSLAAVSKQVGQEAGTTQKIEQNTAAIQQMEWWPVSLYLTSSSGSVQKVIFSFYNLKLYKIAVTYNSEATAGLTAGDMIGAISSNYGMATNVVAETGTPSAYGTVEPPLAQWEDTQYSVLLSHDMALNTFSMVMYTKELNAQAEAVVMEAAKQEKADAPQKEVARAKKAADDLEAERQANLKVFRP